MNGSSENVCFEVISAKIMRGFRPILTTKRGCKRCVKRGLRKLKNGFLMKNGVPQDINLFCKEYFFNAEVKKR